MIYCNLCGKLPADVESDDCLCVTCRIEVTAASEVVHDPVVILLSGHQRVDVPDGSLSLCLCGEQFDGPGPHRMHVAALIYEALGLLGPIPNTPASNEPC